MKSYVLIFKTSISTTYERSNAIDKLNESCEKIKMATIDIDDEDKILRIESTRDDSDTISLTMQKEGYPILLLAVYEQHTDMPILVASN